MIANESNLSVQPTFRQATTIKLIKIVFFLLSAATVIQMLNTPFFVHNYGIEFDVILRTPMLHSRSLMVSIITSLVLIGIMYVLMFPFNKRYYRLMKRFFLVRSFLLPICVFAIFMLSVSFKMFLLHTAEQNVMIYMVSILFSILLNYFVILTILNSIGIQFILVKKVIFDVVKFTKQFHTEDIYVVISSYLNFTFTFATMYFHLQSFSGFTAFHGVEMSPNMFGTLVNFVYFSFITISTTGFGDIYPVVWYAKLLVSVEVLSGVFLLTFSFGIILNSISMSNAVRRLNSKHPVLFSKVMITAKRPNMTEPSNRIASGGASVHFVTFEFENGERLVTRVPDEEYDLMAEGDTGMLTFQGTHFVGFERDKQRVLE